MHDTDSAQQSDMGRLVHDAMWRGSGGWEIAAAPVMFGFIGWLIDGAVGTRPAFTIVFAIAGLSGAVYNIYTSYTQRMERVSAERSEARDENFQQETGQRFGRTAEVEVPSYVLEADLDNNSQREGV